MSFQSTLYLVLSNETFVPPKETDIVAFFRVHQSLVNNLRGRAYDRVLFSEAAHQELTKLDRLDTSGALAFTSALRAQLAQCVSKAASAKQVRAETLIGMVDLSEIDRSELLIPPIEIGSCGSHSRKTISTIWVTFSRIGMHRYPDAPEEVAYLRDLHRHVFQFKVAIQVHHNDREIEFHMFLNWLTSLYDTKVLDLNFKSCEMLAEDVLSAVMSKYNCTDRRIEVTVSEDGECGATLISEIVPVPWSKPPSNRGTAEDQEVPVRKLPPSPDVVRYAEVADDSSKPEHFQESWATIRQRNTEERDALAAKAKNKKRTPPDTTSPDNWKYED